MANDQRIIFGKAITRFDDRTGTPRKVYPVTGPNHFSAYVYQCWLNVDWDGAWTAYGLNRSDTKDQSFPEQKNLSPLEGGATGSLKNARRGGTGDWVGIYATTRAGALGILQANYPHWGTLKAGDQTSILNQFFDDRRDTVFGTLEDLPGNGKFPIVQLKAMNQPKPGYYVSQSMAFDRSKTPINLWDQNIYLDAGEVPYSVVPRLKGIDVGDFGLIIRNATGANTEFLYGDTGTIGGSTRLGECSGYVYNEIAEGKYNDEMFSFIAFPHSGNGAADKAAVKRMKSVLLSLFGKLFDADDTLGRWIGGDDEMGYRNANLALRSWGGPQFSGARAHGGPETRYEDFPDGR
jgi:hypothetical protein